MAAFRTNCSWGTVFKATGMDALCFHYEHKFEALCWLLALDCHRLEWGWGSASSFFLDLINSFVFETKKIGRKCDTCLATLPLNLVLSVIALAFRPSRKNTVFNIDTVKEGFATLLVNKTNRRKYF